MVNNNLVRTFPEQKNLKVPKQALSGNTQDVFTCSYAA